MPAAIPSFSLEITTHTSVRIGGASLMDWSGTGIAQLLKILRPTFTTPTMMIYQLSGLQSSARKGWSSVFLGLHRGDKGHLLENGL